MKEQDSCELLSVSYCLFSAVFFFNPCTPCGVRQTTIDGGIVTSGFNPRTPGGVRLSVTIAALFEFVFQSTHPRRGATLSTRPTMSVLYSFNPRTPGGVRRGLLSLDRRF